MIDEAAILQSRILLIDDQPANLRLLEAMLQREGFSQLLSVSESARALALYAAFDPDLIVLDLMMPELSGYAVLEQLSRLKGPHDFRPVLVVTADATSEARHRALALGAKDFLTKPVDPVEAMLRVWNLLETRWLYRRLQELAGAPMGGEPAPESDIP